MLIAPFGIGSVACSEKIVEKGRILKKNQVGAQENKDAFIPYCTEIYIDCIDYV